MKEQSHNRPISRLPKKRVMATCAMNLKYIHQKKERTDGPVSPKECSLTLKKLILLLLQVCTSHRRERTIEINHQEMIEQILILKSGIQLISQNNC